MRWRKCVSRCGGSSLRRLPLFAGGSRSRIRPFRSACRSSTRTARSWRDGETRPATRRDHARLGNPSVGQRAGCSTQTASAALGLVATPPVGVRPSRISARWVTVNCDVAHYGSEMPRWQHSSSTVDCAEGEARIALLGTGTSASRAPAPFACRFARGGSASPRRPSARSNRRSLARKPGDRLDRCGR